VSVDFEALLGCVPTRNAAVRVEAREQGLLLFVPIKERAWTTLLRSFMPLRRERGYALDRLGAEVYEACDGRRTLERISMDFAERHQLRFHEARLCVMQFIRMLSERRLVAVVVPREQPNRGGQEA